MMVKDYLHWQLVVGPTWLLNLFWNLERALLQYFSVPTMLKTLFSYWHKDKARPRGGGLGNIFEALAWNIISRLIGFLIRTTLLVIWLAVQAVYLFFGVSLFILFLAWPIIAVALIINSLVLLV